MGKQRFVVVGPDIDGQFDVLAIDEEFGESDFIASGSREYCDAQSAELNAEEEAKAGT